MEMIRTGNRDELADHLEPTNTLAREDWRNLYKATKCVHALVVPTAVRPEVQVESRWGRIRLEFDLFECPTIDARCHSIVSKSNAPDVVD